MPTDGPKAGLTIEDATRQLELIVGRADFKRVRLWLKKEVGSAEPHPQRPQVVVSAALVHPHQKDTIYRLGGVYK